MNVCVTSEGTDLNARVDPRFGRCRYFIIVETETLAFRTVDNTNVSATGGAGIRSGERMAREGVKAVLTGHVGPNAFETLRTAGIDIVTGAEGRVRDAVTKYLEGKLNANARPVQGSTYGMPGRTGARRRSRS